MKNMATGYYCGLDAGLEKEVEEITVIIRFNANQSYAVKANMKDTIQDLKNLVSQKAEMPNHHINLVLAGHILSNLRTLQECGLGFNTTVHAFSWSDDGLHAMDTDKDVSNEKSSGHSNHIESISLHAGRGDSDNVTDTPDSQGNATRETGRDILIETSRFFVFCKVCNCVQPGKLRVKCRQCGDGAFLVDRGPSNWEDISFNTMIRGSCKNCQSDIPTFYTRCSISHEVVINEAIVLKHIQSNRRRVECVICGDVMSHVLIFPCPLGHVLCLDCFHQYSSTCLSERRFFEHPIHGYTLPCPVGCEDSYIEENHHFLLLGREKYERYKNFGAEEFVLQNGGVLCPGPSCGMGLFPEENDRRVICGECQFQSCRECLREYHHGPCDEHTEAQADNAPSLQVNDERAERACWERESLSLIETTTKSCPGCKTKTERSGGCMHMICSRCGLEWCWICVKPWDRECQGDHWFG